MNTQANLKLLITSLILGAILGIIGGPVQILVLWGVIGLAIGYLSPNFRSASLVGIVYGFTVSFTFMVHGYNGSEPIMNKLVPLAALGVFGAFCGLVLTLTSRFIKRLIQKKKEPPLR